MLQDYSQSDLIWSIWYNYGYAYEAWGWLNEEMYELESGLEESGLYLGDFEQSLLDLAFYIDEDLPDLAFNEILNALSITYSLFNEGGIFTQFYNCLYCFYDVSEICWNLIAPNDVYESDFNVPLYLNHYTTGNTIDMLREFKRNEYENAELTTLIFDKMKWITGDIEFNENKAVYPENYIPEKDLITVDIPIE